MYPVKEKKNHFLATNVRDIAREISEEAKANGLSDITPDIVFHVIVRIHLLTIVFAKSRRPFFLSYLGYFTPKKSVQNLVDKKKKARKKVLNCNWDFWRIRKEARQQYRTLVKDALKGNADLVSWEVFLKRSGYGKRIQKEKKKYERACINYNKIRI